MSTKLTIPIEKWNESFSRFLNLTGEPLTEPNLYFCVDLQDVCIKARASKKTRDSKLVGSRREAATLRDSDGWDNGVDWEKERGILTIYKHTASIYSTKNQHDVVIMIT